MNPRCLFCVFSYNRGRFLENCIESLEACVPFADIAIFDDASNDGETVAILERLSQKVPVIQPGSVSSRKVGGLYDNMQSALDYAQSYDLVCFVQDDTQVVRSVSPEELAEINGLFEIDQRLGFVHPAFLRGINRSRDQKSLNYQSATRTYRRGQTKQSAGTYFSAILIAKPSRLNEHEWRFSRSEPANDQQAMGVFEKMAYLHAPFVMWLPEVPVYRGKRKTLALRLAEQIRAVGLHPFKTMDDAESEAFKRRPSSDLPIAEDFLTISTQAVRKPWRYHPLQKARFLKMLNNVELALRKRL